MELPRSGIVILVFWLVGTGLVLGQNARDELRFVEGLRQRRLFQLAEFHCRQQLADAALSAELRTELTLELIRCQAARAMHETAEESQHYWEQARETAAEFQRQHPDAPRGLLVRVQDALTVLARGQWYRQQSEVLTEPAEVVQSARQHLRQAARLLDQLHDEIVRELPLRHRASPSAGQLTADELISLQHQVQFQLARVYLNRARCYPSDSEDRLAALTAAVDQLQGPLARIHEKDPLIWSIRFNLAICRRLQGRLTDADQLLESIQQNEASSDLAWLARAEQVRLTLDRNQPQQALAVFSQQRPPVGQAAAELDFAYLETCLALWQTATRDGAETADTWRDRAAQVVRSIEQMHGPYWGRRGDLLLVRTVGLSRAGGHVDILSRTADGLYRQGQWADAVDAYEQAAAQALAGGQTEQGFELRYKAALVEHQQQQHPSASRRLRQLALDLADQPAAPDAHLLAAWNAAQHARSQPESLEQYAQILEEHARRWPTSATADTARWWLGRLHESRNRWQAAAQTYQAVSRNHDQHALAWQAAARCWDQAFAASDQASPPDEQTVQAAAAGFWEQTPIGSGQPQRPWTSAQRFCATQAARLLLEYSIDGHAQAETILRTALDGSPPPDDDWRWQAEPLWILSLAGQPDRRSMAAKELATSAWPTVEAYWTVLIGMHRQMRPLQFDPEQPRGIGLEQTDQQPGQEHRHNLQHLADLQMTVIDRLWSQRPQLDAQQGTKLEQVRAETFLAAQRRDQAQAAYAQLAAKHPDDQQIQKTYARLLLESESPDAWQQGLDAWRRIAARQRPGTEGWYEARYAIAAALIQLDQPDQAASRIRYLQALPPGLDGTPWQSRFQTLLDQANSPRQ
jgi:tetratricopeptide (TPR) repeat protein